MMICVSFVATCSKKVSPPVVTFVATLAVAALGLLFYSHYISTHTIPDPNIQDWNSFLFHFDEMKFCVNDNGDEPSTIEDSKVYRALSADRATSQTLINISTEIDAIISYTNVSLLEKYSHLVFLVPAKAFGIQGVLNETEVLGIVSLSGPSLDGPYSAANCSDGVSASCHRSVAASSDVSVSGHKEVSACLHLFTDTSLVFPQYKASPVPCTKSDHTNTVWSLVSEKQLKMIRKLAKASYSCGDRVASSTTTGAPQQRTTLSESEKGNATTKSKQIDYFSLKLSHQFDIELAAYLSMGDKALINLHLIHTSYFLLVLMCLFTVFSFVRSRQSKDVKHVRVDSSSYSPSESPVGVEAPSGVVFLSDSEQDYSSSPQSSTRRNSTAAGGKKFTLLHEEED